MLYSRPLAALIAQLERLPGIGPKSAQRLAFHLLRQPDEAVEQLAEVLVNAKRTTRLCETCQSFSSTELCEICSDPRRDAALICVVADPKDVAAFERLNEFRGTYHVLHGQLSPMDGVGPDQLKLKELVMRAEAAKEIILATNPTVEGDATALYIAQLLRPLGPRITRLAHGIPIGGDLDFADQATLLSALEHRREM